MTEAAAARARTAWPAVALFFAGILSTALIDTNPAFAAPAISTQPKDIEVTARALPSFLIGDRDKNIFGDLEWLGGLELIGSTRHFGSLSGVTVGEDGSAFLAVTDNGFWVKGRVIADGSGAPTGLAGVRIAPMLDRRGNVLNLKASADAESIDQGTHGGKPVYVVAFEREHRIEAYERTASGFPGRPVRIPAPKAIRNLRANKGIESIALGRPGTPSEGLTVLIAERSRRSGGNIPGWVAQSGGKYRAFQIRLLDDFDVTDAAFLPDGDLLVLERRFSYASGIFMRLRRISAHTLRTESIIDGPVLMTADFTHQIDNMEGLAVHRAASGDVILTIVSDDNRSILQRNLLLRFRLRQPGLETKPQPRPAVSTE